MVINFSGTLWDFGFYQINLFGFVIAVCFVVMLVVMFSEKKAEYFGKWFLYELMLESAALAFVGARLLFFVERYFLTRQVVSFSEIINISGGGGSVTGALLLSVPYIFFRVSNAGFNSLELFDFILPKVSLTYALSRFGCLFVGCCHGFVMCSPAWFSVVYRQSPFALNNIPYFPSQAVVIASSFCSFLFLNYYLSSKKTQVGFVSAAFFIIEGSLRFLMEFIRPDVIYLAFGLTLIQCVCLFIVSLGFLILIYANKLLIKS